MNSMKLIFRLAYEEEKDSWDRVVQRSDAGTWLHLWEIEEVLAEHLDCEIVRFCCEQDGDLVSVLPMFLVDGDRIGNSRRLFLWYHGRPVLFLRLMIRSMIKGHLPCAISTPLSGYGGPVSVSSSGVDPNAMTGLIQYCSRFLSKMVRSIQITMSPIGHDAATYDALVRNGYELTCEDDFLVNLRPPLREIEKRFNKDCRIAVRQGLRRGAEIVKARSTADLETCWQMSSLRFEEQGKRATIPLALYLKLHEVLSRRGYVRAYLARFGGVPIGGMSCVVFPKWRAIYWVSGFDHKYRRLRPQNLLLYHAICDLKDEGAESFELGRATTAGLKKWKSDWGSEVLRVHHFERVM